MLELIGNKPLCSGYWRSQKLHFVDHVSRLATFIGKVNDIPLSCPAWFSPYVEGDYFEWILNISENRAFSPNLIKSSNPPTLLRN